MVYAAIHRAVTILAVLFPVANAFANNPKMKIETSVFGKTKTAKK